MKKRILSLSILLFMLAFLFAPAMKAEAAVKISKAKATLEVDATLALKINGASKDAKITWSSSKKSVATVNNSGKVTAKSEGSATITAKVSGKSYTCAVTVVNSNKEIADTSQGATIKNIKCTTYETESDLIAILKNNNKSVLGYVGVTVTYYDKSNKMLSTDNTTVPHFGVGKEVAISFDYPVDKNYDPVEYDSFTIDLKISDFSVGTSIIDDIVIQSSKGANDDVVIKATNNSNYKANGIDMAVVFTQGGKVVGISRESLYSLGSGDSDTGTAYAPYGRDYETIEYDDYKVYINDAYTYDK